MQSLSIVTFTPSNIVTLAVRHIPNIKERRWGGVLVLTMRAIMRPMVIGVRNDRLVQFASAS